MGDISQMKQLAKILVIVGLLQTQDNDILAITRQDNDTLPTAKTIP